MGYKEIVQKPIPSKYSVKQDITEMHGTTFHALAWNWLLFYETCSHVCGVTFCEYILKSPDQQNLKHTNLTGIPCLGV
jgi:hypothetical protein